MDPLSVFVDGVIPVWDPLAAAETTAASEENGLGWSRCIGVRTRNTVVALYAIQAIGTSSTFARSTMFGRQSRLFAQGAGLANKSPWLRMGWGGQLGVPNSFFRVVIGSKRWILPWLRHLDIR